MSLEVSPIKSSQYLFQQVNEKMYDKAKVH